MILVPYKNSPYVNSFDEIFTAESSSARFSRSSEERMPFFFPFRLFDGVRIQYS